jgi:hypothetical protein
VKYGFERFVFRSSAGISGFVEKPGSVIFLPMIELSWLAMIAELERVLHERLGCREVAGF